MKRPLFIKILAVACCLLSTTQARAASQVDARLDTTAMRIGDPLTLTVTVRTEPGERVTFPELSRALGEFELLSSNPPERYEDGSGAVLERRSWQVTTFETGRRVIPPLAFGVVGADGAVDTLRTPELPVLVAQVLQDTLHAEVRPLKSLLGVPRRWHKLLWWALAGLAVLSLVIWLLRRRLARRDRSSEGREAPLAPRRPAHLVALEELDRIKGLGLIEQGEIKLFHSLVSDAIRRFLEDRFAILAVEMTTWEIERSLERVLAGDEQGRRLAAELLAACDLVKFAKYRPSLVEINSVFNQAYGIVERFRPVIVPPMATEEAALTSGGGDQAAGGSA